LDGVEEETIDAIVEQFESEDVALIIGGRCATFVPEEPSPDAKYRARKKARGNGARSENGDAPREADAPISGGPGDAARASREGSSASREGPSASREGPSASRERVESSDPKREQESSSVVVPFAARADAPAEPTRDDDEFFIREIVKAGHGKIPATVARVGVADVRDWIGDGCDFASIILPTIRTIAARLKEPMRVLQHPKFKREIFAARDGRLAAERDREANLARAPPPRPPPRAEPTVAPVSEEKRREIGAMIRELAEAMKMSAALPDPLDRRARRAAPVAAPLDTEPITPPAEGGEPRSAAK
jgi:hypothetical protein